MQRTLQVICWIVLGLAAPVTAALAATGSVTLHWTAPGDDALIGRAAAYDLRYSLAPITSASFGAATPVAGVPAPGTPGSPESFTVTGLAPGKSYYFAIKTVDEAANWSSISNVIYIALTTAANNAAPVALWLSAPWPNPAADAARWSYALPQAGAVDLEAFDIAGRHVRTITRGWRGAGEGEVAWDLRDDDGRRIAPGIYLVRARLGGQSWMRRVVVTN